MTGLLNVTSILRGARRFTNVWEMLPKCSTSEVRRVRNQFYTVFYLLMLTTTAIAFPSRTRIIEEPNRSIVIFNSQVCRPVNPEHLQLRMGKSFDSSKMLTDEESVKRSVENTPGSALLEENDDDDYHSDDNIEDISTDSPYGDVEKEERRIDVQDSLLDNYKSVMGLRGQMPMRRRRRRSVSDVFSDNNDYVSLYQMMLGSATHASQSNAKRKARNIRSSQSQLPWQCKMKTVWKKMKEDYFPPYVQSGKCQSKKCMLGSYQCSPKKYEIKVLKRDSDGCNPLPTVGLNTTYEERWVFERYHVTVCCECGRRTNKKGRRRQGKGRKSKRNPA